MPTKINYYAREYTTVLQDLLTFVRTNFPDQWSDFQNSNAGMVQLQLIAYAYAIQSFSIDKTANETFSSTAQQRKNVLKIADELGYQPRGRIASAVLADAALNAALTGPSAAVLRKGTRIKSTQGLSFEVREDTSIDVGETTPRIPIASELNTIPVGALVNFISGRSDVRFADEGGNNRFAATIEAGMWIANTQGLYTDWYRIQSVAADASTIYLSRPWNASFELPFIIRTQANESNTSAIILTSVPYGTFQATATGTVNSNTVEFSRALPDSVIVGHFFRMNAPNSEANRYFRITGISKDRKSITLDTAYGPVTAGGFDSPNATFSVEQRGVVLIQGESRLEEFISTNQANQTYTLGESEIILGSIEVYDEDGVTDTDDNPKAWTPVSNLTLATGDNLRGYRARLLDQDTVSIEFGDGTIGQVPTGKITVKYMVGGGSQGDVPKNSLNTNLLAFQGAVGVTVKVTNPETVGVGGLDSEGISELKLNIPAHLSTNLRGVIGNDYNTLIKVDYPQSAGALGSVFIVSVDSLLNQVPYGGNFIYIYCWSRERWRPVSSKSPADVYYYRYVPVPSTLQTSVQDFVNQYKMMTDTPLILKGVVNEAIIQIDVKIPLSADPVAMEQAIESALVDLFNSSRTVDRQPILVSDVYHAVDEVIEVDEQLLDGSQSRLRKMFLDVYNTLAPDSVNDTPVTLQTVGNLYPRGATDVVVPGDIVINIWNREQPLTLYLEARLYGYNFAPPDTTLAQETVRRTVEKYFYDLAPGAEANAEAIMSILKNSFAGGEAQHLPDVKTASNTNLPDVANTVLSTTPPTVGGVALQDGDRILLKDQSNQAENGVYVFKFDGTNPWSLTRPSDADSYFTLTAGSYMNVLVGLNANTSWFFNTHGLNPNTFAVSAKIFTLGTREDAEATIKVIVGGYGTLRFDSPVGNAPTQFLKQGVPLTMYTLKNLSINQI